MELPKLPASRWLSEVLPETGLGALILTATGRLQRHLHEAFAAEQERRGQTAWTTPPILTWSAWLDRQWQEHLLGEAWRGAPAGEPSMLLQPAQSAALWQRIVAADPVAAKALRPAGLAAQAEEAWELLHAWELSFAPADARTPEEASFARWVRDYSTHTESRGWTDGARLPRLISGWIESERLPVPHRVVLAGFDTFDPAQQHLIAALVGKGSVCLELEAPKIEAAVRRVTCADPEAEARSAARWARARLDQGTSNIGIVVQGLEGRAPEMARALREFLAPETALPGEYEGGPVETKTRNFHVSVARRLAHWPLVRTALRLIRLSAGAVPLDELETVLLSPYLGAIAAEREQRGLLVVRLRERGDPKSSLSVVARLGADLCPALADRLIGALRLFDGLPPRQSFADWATHFTAVLRAYGWPHQGAGGRNLGSGEFQCFERWRDLLDELCALDLVLPLPDRREALARLEELASDARFEPKADPASVQVLGHLEAAGLSFDTLWVMGLDDENWPPPLHPNPFLPLAVQRARGLPRSSAAREFAFAEGVTSRLKSAASEIVFSHAETEHAARLRPSPLIADLPEVTLDALHLPESPGLVELIRQSALQEPRVETPLRLIAPGTAQRSGARLFQDMAACPFRAQAMHRLGAEDVSLPQHELNPLDHGSLVHAALHSMWTRLKTQAGLEGLDPEELARLLAAAAKAALAGLEGSREKLTPGLRELEIERLTRLVGELLQWERYTRPAFSVESSEAAISATVGGVALQLRTDRVDALADGTRLIIDYKTGEASATGWVSDRPEAPQLPLYAVASPHPPQALAFAKVRTGEVRFTGVSAGETGIPGIVTCSNWKAARETGSAWQELMAGWRRTLDALGERFRAGDAAVAPKARETCAHCPLPGLCRIDEHGLLARDGDSAVSVEDDAS